MTQLSLAAFVTVSTLALATCADGPDTAEAAGASETASADAGAAEDGAAIAGSGSGETDGSGNSDTETETADAGESERERLSRAERREREELEGLAERLARASDQLPGDEDWLRVAADGEDPPHPVWQETVMPGETISFSADSAFALAREGALETGLAESHDWTAPEEAGNHQIIAFNKDGARQVYTVFVLKPLPDKADARLEGYRIGQYPQNTPEGLIRLTEEDMDLPVSPNFEIGQFICKQQPGHWPKFLLVTDNMLVRIEALIAELRERDRTDARQFFIMSGYRTPFYNTAIGSARLSRHMYGDASDVFVDVDPQNSVMDDINGDGRVTRADAEYLYDLANELFTGDSSLPLGGIGAYGSNAVHGPFVHVDGRGRAARWGR